MSTRVLYNGTEISPTPFVSREASPIDIGQRWGHFQNIKVDGVITGYSGTGKLGALTGIFAQTYKTLLIESPTGVVFAQMNNCVLDSISIGENRFGFEESYAVPYSVNLRSYSMTSGVMDVSNNYSFSNGRNGIISIAHEVSARGVNDGNDPLDNAYSFVSLFTGRSPLSIVSPVFNQTGTPILISVNEEINRVNATYSVTENWTYEESSSHNYTTVSSLNISSRKDSEYPTASLSVEFVGPVTGTIDSLRNAVSGYNFNNKLSEFNLQSGDFFINSMSFDEREPNSISATVNFVSGFQAEFTSGVFKKSISMDWDEVEDVKTYSIDSQFVINGPPEYRLAKIQQALTDIKTDYRHYIAYLYNEIKGSPLFSGFGDKPLNPLPESVSINYDTTSPSLSMKASFNDTDFYTQTVTNLPNGLTYPISIGKIDYQIDFKPEVWIFDIQPASNIEGHFIVQDLNCKTRNQFSVNITNLHPSDTIQNGAEINPIVAYDKTLAILSGIADQISTNRYETNRNVNSGNHTHSIQTNYFGNNCVDPRLSANKFYGFLGSSYNTRSAGYRFGF